MIKPTCKEYSSLVVYLVYPSVWDVFGGIQIIHVLKRLPEGGIQRGGNWETLECVITWRIIPFSKWLITMVSKSPQ